MTPAAAVCAQLVAIAAEPTGLSHIEAGDAAWDALDRRSAKEAWTAAAASPHPAVAAMGEARLLQVSGNLGLLVHGPRLDSALARCPIDSAWCRVAWADSEWFSARIGIPQDSLPDAIFNNPVSDPTAAQALAQRAAWRTGQGPRPGPGTWIAGVSPLASTGLGVGAALVWHHPDVGLAGHQASLSAGATASGTVLASGTFTGGHATHLHAEAGLRRQRWAVFDDRTPAVVATSVTATAGPGWRGESVTGWAAPTVRTDTGVGVSAGLAGEVSHSQGLWRARVRGEVLGGAGPLGTGQLEVRRGPSTGLAGRLVVQPTWRPETTPLWRAPAWGGGEVVRHGPWGRYRAPLLSAAVIEQRTRSVGVLSGVVFAETGAMLRAADWWLLGAGAGVRLALPPQPSGTLRVDVGAGTAGVGVSAGWGQAF